MCEMMYLFLPCSAVLLEVRLRGGYTDAEGRVEVLRDGSWGTITSDQWSLAEASVVCRMLGYPAAFDLPSYFGFLVGSGSRDILLYDVKCWGMENNLGYCNYSEAPTEDYQSGAKKNVAAVNCTNTCKYWRR